jgi:hypothetical protein
MPVKGVLTLAVTILLSLPSILGGLALLVNLLLQRHFGQWVQGSGTLVAVGMFIGSPLVILATVVGVVVALRPLVSMRMKAAHLIVVGLGAAATISLALLFHFAG